MSHLPLDSIMPHGVLLAQAYSPWHNGEPRRGGGRMPLWQVLLNVAGGLSVVWIVASRVTEHRIVARIRRLSH